MDKTEKENWAKIKEAMEESGNTNKLDNPSWLQRPENGTGNQDGNEDRKDNSTNSSETKATTTQ